MKKLKTTATQDLLISQALNASSDVLRAIKQQRLEGDALDKMKVLETAVQSLECFQLVTVFHKPR